MELYFFHISLGCVSGLIFSLMFINFDATWKKIFSWMLTFAVDGGAIALFKSTGLPIDNNFWGALGSMMMAFIVAFIVVMIIVYRITKKQDDGNVITFKDIFLGQKSHINIYYKQRKDEITKKILPELEERERKIEEEKEAIAEQDRRLRKEWNKLNDASNKKIKMILPVNNHIIVSKTYFESLPSYMSDLAECIKDLHKTTNSLIEKNKTLLAKLDEFANILKS